MALIPGRPRYPGAAWCKGADNSSLALTIREERQIVISLLPAHRPTQGIGRDRSSRIRDDGRSGTSIGRVCRAARRVSTRMADDSELIVDSGNLRPEPVPGATRSILNRCIRAARPAYFAQTREPCFTERGTRSATAGYEGDADSGGTSNGAPDQKELVRG